MEDVGSAASQSMQTLESSAGTGAEAMDSVQASAESVKTSLDEAGASAENFGSDLRSAGSATSEFEGLEGTLTGIAEGLAGLGITTFLAKAVSMAGKYEDSWTRVGLAFKGTGLEMKTLKSIVEDLTDATGRSGGVIRETLLRLGVAGVTSASTLKSAFEGISASAFVTGNSIENVAASYTRMVQTGMFSSRMFAQLGISDADVMRYTGMAIDEVKAKFKSMTAEQRAALLNQILLDKYGVEANNAYKSSWEGLMEALRIARDRLSRLVGAVVLPVAIPAVRAFAGALSGLGDAFNGLPGPVKTVTGAVVGLIGGTLLLSGAVKTLGAAISWLIPGFIREAVAGEASALAKAKNTLANQALMYSTYGSASAMEVAVGAAMAHAGAVEMDTAAQNMGLLSSIRYTAALAWQRIVTAASTVYTYALAAAQWALNAAMAASPVTWIVLAIVGLVAVLVILYQRVQWVRDGINWLWDQLKGFAEYIWGGVMKALQGLWGLLQGIGGVIYTVLIAALQGLWGVLQPVVSAVGGFLSWLGRLIVSFYTTTEGVRSLISALGPLGVWISFLINPLQTLRFIFEQLRMAWDQWVNSAEGQAVLGQLRAAFNDLGVALNQLWAALQPVFQALSDAWAELSKAINPAREAGNAVKGVGSGASQASGPLQIFVEIIRIVGWILQYVVVPAIRLLADIIRALAPVIQGIAMVISGFIQGLILVGQVIGTVVSFISQFNSALSALLRGNITVTQFLSIVWNAFRATIGAILMQIVLAVVRFGAQLISAGLRAGLGFVRSVVSAILGLPGRIWMYLLVAVQRARNWTNRMWAIARQTGQKVIDGVMQFLRRLPGMVWNELMNTINRIKQAPGKAYDAAKEFGKRIWDGAKKGLGISSPGHIYRDVQAELDRVKTEFDERKTELGGAARSMAEGISSSFRVTASVSASAAPAPAPAIDSSPMRTVANETVGSMKTISTSTRTTLTSMQSNFKSSLNNVVNTNTRAMNNVALTTRRGLDQVKKSTVTEVGNVRKSWTGMQNALTGAATTIKNRVTGEINKLSANMGRFWRRVQNPASLIGAGGPAGAPSMSIRIPSGAYSGPDPLNLGEYFDDDLLPACEDEPCYAGGWDYSSPWTRRALDAMYRWNFNLWGYNMPVGLFRNTSTPRIPVGAFARMVMQIIGRTRYAFYYNSRYPSPAAALRAGAFNCFDGALIVLALARAFGLSGSMRHGYWGPFRHVWANVEGVDIDTTAIQHGYGLTSPKVHAGPGPDITPGSASSASVKLDHRVTVEVNVRADGVDSGVVEEAIREARLDEQIRRGLLEDETFKDRLLRVIGERISREERYYGI